MITLNERRNLGHLKHCNRKTVVVLVLEGGMKDYFKNVLESNDFVYSHLFFSLSLILGISSTYSICLFKKIYSVHTDKHHSNTCVSTS